MKVAGIDVSPEYSYVCILDTDHPTGILSYPEVTDQHVAKLCADMDLVVVETPEVRHGVRREIVRHLMRTSHHAGELSGLLKFTLGPGRYVLEPSPEMIREVVCRILKFSAGTHDRRIKNWIEHTHLRYELRFSPEQIKACMKAKGPLSTPDKRDAYLCSRFGIMTAKSKLLQLSCFGRELGNFNKGE